MANVILLCGRIASGKSTLAQKLQRRGRAVLLSCDELMLTLFDQCLGARHDAVLERCSRYLFSVAEQVTAAGADAVLDFGFWTKSSREQAKAYFEKKGIEVELWYLPVEREEQRKRLARRNEQLKDSPRREYIIGEELFCRLDAKFQEPSSREIDRVVEPSAST